MQTDYATLILQALRGKYRYYAYDDPAFASEKWWYFVLSSNANDQSVFFAPGPTVEYARTRLESSVRLLVGHPHFHMAEYESGPVVIGPVCRRCDTWLRPFKDYFFRRLRFWKCGNRDCTDTAFSFRLRGHPAANPYCLAGVGTAFDICEGT